MSKVEKTWIRNGLKCKVVFANNSHRCGYVKLPNNHIAYGIYYDKIDVDVHGGLTYGEINDKGDYWVGFDCAHAGDKVVSDSDREGHFWTLQDVIKETNKLADHLILLRGSQILGYEIREFLREVTEEEVLNLRKEVIVIYGVSDK